MLVIVAVASENARELTQRVRKSLPSFEVFNLRPYHQTTAQQAPRAAAEMPQTVDDPLRSTQLAAGISEVERCSHKPREEEGLGVAQPMGKSVPLQPAKVIVATARAKACPTQALAVGSIQKSSQKSTCRWRRSDGDWRKDFCSKHRWHSADTARVLTAFQSPSPGAGNQSPFDSRP